MYSSTSSQQDWSETGGGQKEAKTGVGVGYQISMLCWRGSFLATPSPHLDTLLSDSDPLPFGQVVIPVICLTNALV